MEGVIENAMESIPGLKFHPSDEELLLQHLRPKIKGTRVDSSCVVPEVEVCQYDPWHLPKLFNELSMWKSREGTREWTFFCPRKRKYSNGQRSERTTPSGYWKVTGAKRNAKAEDGTMIGTKKTLVFYKGRVPKGKRTNWVMHEYHLNALCLSDDSYGDQLPYVACRIKVKKDKKGMNTSDYPTDDSDRNSPYTVDVADYTQVNEGHSSSCNTPTSFGGTYRDSTGDQYDKFQLPSDGIFGSFPNLPRLNDGATPEHNDDRGDSFSNGPVSPPPLFSPSSLIDYDSYFNWDCRTVGYD